MSEEVSVDKDKKFRMQGAAFLGLVGGTAALIGFSRTLSQTKKSESKIIEQGGREAVLLLDEGSMLAMRALGWGTLYAILGTGAFCYGIWKLSGAKNMEEFRMTMGKNLPKLTTNEPPKSRTDFESLTDLIKYVTTWGN